MSKYVSKSCCARSQRVLSSLHEADNNHGHVTTINMLPVDVLLKIFDFCQLDSNGDGATSRPGSEWHSLAHVCYRWRVTVFASPRRLDLTLFCTHGTPVRKNLGCWPPFPIIMDYLTSRNRSSPAPDYEDDIIAALEHPDRVRGIKLDVTSALLAMMASVMQEPFLALTTLWLTSKDRNAPILPDVFLSGSVPHLLQFYLAGISFPALPTFLLSSSDLVDLQLKDIPQGGYISPEAMVTSLATLTRLDSLCIWFKSPTSRLQPRYSPSSMRDILPSLVAFNFRGCSEYLEHLLARIDTPRLHSFIITYFNQLDLQVPQLSQFIRRTENLELAQSQHAQVRIRISKLYIELDFKEDGHSRSRLNLCISCKWLDWQVSHLAQILSQSPAMVSNVDHLSIDEVDLQLVSSREDDMDDADWLELLRPFTAVKMLHGSKQLAGHVALALDGISGDVVTEVLPSLESLLLEDQPARSIEQFIAVRQLSGHPVTFIDSYPTLMADSQNDVLFWTSQDPRQSQLFSQWGAVYRFQTDVNAHGRSVTSVWRAIRANKEDRVARLEWAPGGGLGRAVIGKNVSPMADLVRRDPRMPSSRVFNGPDGLQYRWRPSTNSQDIVLQDPDNNVIAFIRPTRPKRYQLGDVYAELHFIRSAGAGVVMHPPLMDMVTVTAMLYRFASAFDL